MGSFFKGKSAEEIETEKVATEKILDDTKNTRTQTGGQPKAPCKVRSLMQISLSDKLLQSGEVFDIDKQGMLDELLTLKAVEVVK